MKTDSTDGLGGFVELNKVIHEPARLIILALLQPLDAGDFTFLLRETRLTRGNLASHLSKLEEAGYVTVTKGYDGRIPRTTYSLTDEGRKAFADYCKQIRHMASLLPENQS